MRLALLGCLSLFLGCVDSTSIATDRDAAPDTGASEVGSSSDAPSDADLLPEATSETSIGDAFDAGPIDPVLSRDFDVGMTGTSPPLAGRAVSLRVRERVRASVDGASSLEGHVVVFVHGPPFPGTAVYDLDETRSFARALAERGFAAYAFDLAGYGGSTRPAPMGEPCNLDADGQKAVGVSCFGKHGFALTSPGSELEQLDAVVEWVKARRKVSRVHLFSVSFGADRLLHFAAVHPEKVARIGMHGAGGNGAFTPSAPSWAYPEPAFFAMQASTKDGFVKFWAEQARDSDQVESGSYDLVWSALQKTDALGATWGVGVVRYPNGGRAYGASFENLQKIAAPALVVGSDYDTVNGKGAVDALYGALTMPQRIRATINGSSHVLGFETRAKWLWALAAEWFDVGSIDGRTLGKVEVARDGVRYW